MALCRFAAKLTIAPSQMTDDDIHRLRDHDFSDEQIVVATQVIGYFNYINRIADALGVEDEAWMELTKEEWERRRGRDYSHEFTE